MVKCLCTVSNPVCYTCTPLETSCCWCTRSRRWAGSRGNPRLWVHLPRPCCGWAMHCHLSPACCRWVMYGSPTPALGGPCAAVTPAVDEPCIIVAPLPWVSHVSLLHPCRGCALPRCCTPAVGELCLAAAPLPWVSHSRLLHPCRGYPIYHPCCGRRPCCGCTVYCSHTPALSGYILIAVTCLAIALLSILVACRVPNTVVPPCWSSLLAKSRPLGRSKGDTRRGYGRD